MALCKLLTVLSIVAAASAGMVVHESRAAVPAGFVRKGVAPANDTITLRVALASNNVAGLEQKLLSLSTPGSSDFRQWLSMEDVREFLFLFFACLTRNTKVKSFVQPSSETVSTFNAFASANGLKPTVISPNGDWVSITLPVSQANTLFAAQFEVFTHPAMSDTITRTLSVSLPSELVGHVDVIHPTTEFVEPNTRLIPTMLSLDKRAVNASCDTSVASGVVTPNCLQEMYGIPTTPATESSNAVLVTAYEGEFAQAADLSVRHFIILFCGVR